jgi:hypothetical protein
MEIRTFTEADADAVIDLWRATGLVHPTNEPRRDIARKVTDSPWGFLVLTESAEFLYKTTDYYAPEHERCIVWNDPELAIVWPLTAEPVVSAKDQQGMSFAEAVPRGRG